MKLGFHIGRITPGATMEGKFTFPVDYDFDAAFRYIEANKDTWLGAIYGSFLYLLPDSEYLSPFFNGGKRVYRKYLETDFGDEGADVYWVVDIDTETISEILSNKHFNVTLMTENPEDIYHKRYIDPKGFDFIAYFWIDYIAYPWIDRNAQEENENGN